MANNITGGREAIGKTVATANVAGDVVPVDHNGAYPLAGWEIEGALHGVVPVFSPLTHLPNFPGVYVYNTRTPCQTTPTIPGHWVAVRVPQSPDLPVEFFDSFGRPPSAYGLDDVICKRKQIIYNPLKLQESGTFACGHYVIAYCAFQLVGWTMDDYLDLFNPSTPRENDCIALELATPMVHRLAESYKY